MLACVVSEQGVQLRTDWPQPARRGEARIRPRLAGICATDLELLRGYKGFRGVIGHEWVGVVEDAPDASWLGARVVGDINCPCRTCPTCQAGRATHCPRRTALGIVGRDGVFAESFCLPLANLHRVPDSLSDEAAVFCEPLAAALQVLEQVHVKPSQRAAVLGLGKLGRLCLAVLALGPAEVWGLARRASQLEHLPEGAHGGLADAADLPAFDLIVEATGSSAGLGIATRLLRPGGRLVLKSTLHGQARLQPTPWVVQEMQIIGSRCGPFAPALRLLAESRIDPRPLIAARYPLERALEALEHAAQSGVLKVLIELP